jgi:TonB family protein
LQASIEEFRMNQRKDSAPDSQGDPVDSRSTDGLSHWLIHRAALRGPDTLRERLEEEWLADIAARTSSLSRLRFAIGCCWATRVIAYEQSLALAPATNPVAAPKLSSASGQFNWGHVSRRSSTLFLILTLHVAVFYVVMTSISHTHGAKIPDPLVNSVVKKDPIKDPPPMLPGVNFTDATIVIPKGHVIDIPQDVDRGEITANFGDGSRVVLPPEGSFEPVSPRVRVPGGPGAGFPNTDDYYPASTIRAGQEGAVTMQVCVDTRGRLTSAPTTLQRAGIAPLDEAALRLARAGSGHYRATTEDGRPIDSCYPIRVRFQLKR